MENNLINSFEIPKNLEVRFIDDTIGYGVFTTKPIKKGDIVEICYCLEFDTFIGHFLDYIFENPETNKKLVPFGYGSIYNHDRPGNIRWIVVSNNNKFIKFSGITRV